MDRVQLQLFIINKIINIIITPPLQLSSQESQARPAGLAAFHSRSSAVPSKQSDSRPLRSPLESRAVSATTTAPFTHIHTHTRASYVSVIITSTFNMIVISVDSRVPLVCMRWTTAELFHRSQDTTSSLRAYIHTQSTELYVYTYVSTAKTRSFKHGKTVREIERLVRVLHSQSRRRSQSRALKESAYRFVR